MATADLEMMSSPGAWSLYAPKVPAAFILDDLTLVKFFVKADKRPRSGARVQGHAWAVYFREDFFVMFKDMYAGNICPAVQAHRGTLRMIAQGNDNDGYFGRDEDAPQLSPKAALPLVPIAPPPIAPPSPNYFPDDMDPLLNEAGRFQLSPTTLAWISPTAPALYDDRSPTGVPATRVGHAGLESGTPKRSSASHVDNPAMKPATWSPLSSPGLMEFFNFHAGQ